MISVSHNENSAQFVNAIFTLLCGVTFISPAIKINESKKSQRLNWILKISNLVELFSLKNH